MSCQLSLAQSPNMTLNDNAYTVERLSLGIKQQTNYNVSYNANEIDAKTIIRLKQHKTLISTKFSNNSKSKKSSIK